MAPPGNKKRSYDAKFKSKRPQKRLKRKQQTYHSDSEDEKAGFSAVNLIGSDDEDIHNATVEDIQETRGQSSSDEGADAPPPPKKTAKMSMRIKQPKKSKPSVAKAPSSDEDDSEEEDGAEESDSDMDDVDDYEAQMGLESRKKHSKSKRNDPNAFATSLSKILSTKLSTSKRSDPVLARSAAAHDAAQAAADSALEAKARRQMREQKRRALEKGRVRDVLVATTNDATGELESSTSEIMETERRLRKVAQRGVVRLFNAVRAAQVAAASAEKGVRRDGVLGMGKREEKINEMTKKGFLDLIASGGGGLSKNALEEA